MYRSLLSLALVLSPLAACGTTSDAAPAGPTAKAPPPGTSTDQELCVEVFTRNRACTDDFIPALVDVRAKLDKPPGMAASVRSDRDAVIAEAKREWAEDSKDEAIARNCRQITANMSEADREDGATSRGCLVQHSCDAYVACIRPVFEKHLGK
jgi:hypothetical protein